MNNEVILCTEKVGYFMYIHGLYVYGVLDCPNLINFDISCDGIMDCKYGEDKSHL